MSAQEPESQPEVEPENEDWDDWEEMDEEAESFPRMSFLDHLDELRSRLTKMVLFLLLAVIFSWSFVDAVWSVLEGPARRMLAEAQEKSLSLTQQAKDLRLEIDTLPALPEGLEDNEDLQEFRELVNRHLQQTGEDLELQIRDILVAKDSKLMQTAVGEAFFLKVKIAFMTGLVFCYPLLIYQIWAFVAPGLYRRERRIAIPFIFFSTLFFIGGLMFGYFVAVPFAGSFLMQFGTEFVQLITINKYMDFLVTMMLGLGIVFEIPMAIFLLSKMGIATPRWLLKNFRYAVLIIVIAAAILTPTGDPVNLTLFSVPMILLYLLGVVVSWIWGPKRKDEEEWEDDEEEEEGEEEDEDDDEYEDDDDNGDDDNGDDDSDGKGKTSETKKDKAVKDPYVGEIYDESQPYPLGPQDDEDD